MLIADAQEHLSDLLFNFQDIEWKVFELMQERLTSSGINFPLYNDHPVNLYDYLLIDDKLILELDFFFIFGNYGANYRKYLHKVLLFEDKSHKYSVSISYPDGSQTNYIKADEMDWSDFLKSINISHPQATLNIKETSKGNSWYRITNSSYLNNPSEYYTYLTEKFVCEFSCTKHSYINKWFKHFKIPTVISKQNKELVLKALNLSQISTDLYYLFLLQKVSLEQIEDFNNSYTFRRKPLDFMYELLKKS